MSERVIINNNNSSHSTKTITPSLKKHHLVKDLYIQPIPSSLKRRLSACQIINSSEYNSNSNESKKQKWIKTSKIARKQGPLIFTYFSKEENIMKDNNEEVALLPNSLIRRQVYCILTPKKLELFEMNDKFTIPQLISDSPFSSNTIVNYNNSKTVFPTSFSPSMCSNSNNNNNATSVNNFHTTMYNNNVNNGVFIATKQSLPYQPQIEATMTPTTKSTCQQYLSNMNEKYSSLIGKVYLSEEICNGKVLITKISATKFKLGIAKKKRENQLRFSSVANGPSSAFGYSQQQQEEEGYIQEDIAKVNQIEEEEEEEILYNNESFSCNSLHGTSRGFTLDMQEEEEEEDLILKRNTITNNNSRAIVENEDEVLFFETSSEYETNQWITEIQQVIAALHNEQNYLLTEILFHIFEYLPANDLLKGVAPCTRKFYQLVQQDLIWEQLFKSKFEKSNYDLNYYRGMLANVPMAISSPVVGQPNVVQEEEEDESVNILLDPQTITWKYLFKKRTVIEKQHLTNEIVPPVIVTNNTTTVDSNTNNNTATPSNNSPATTSENLTPEQIEKFKKEMEEQKRKEEEERKRQISSNYLKKGNTLFNIADKCTKPITKRLLWITCVDQYDASLLYNEKNWTAARNWCVSLIRLEKLVSDARCEPAQQFFTLVLNQCVDKFEKCLKYAPKNDEILTLFAGTYSDIAMKMVDMKVSEELFTKAHERFEEALKIKPHIGTFNDFGISYCDFADKRIKKLKRKIKEKLNGLNTQLSDEDVVNEKKKIANLLGKSSKLYESCLSIKADYFHALNNLGFNEKLKIDLLKLQRRYFGLNITSKQLQEYKEERRTTVERACSFYRRCIEIKDYVIARNNYGNILLDEAKEEIEDSRKFELCCQCIEQYEAAIKLEANNDACACRLSVAYLMKAEIIFRSLRRRGVIAIPNEEKTVLDEIYEKARNGFKALKNVPLSHYNLACLNSVYNYKEECKKELKDCLCILTEQKLTEDTDLNNVRNETWFIEIINQCRNKTHVK
ncbi:hypothetical protein ABK040_013423 [Willaertia magna]